MKEIVKEKVASAGIMIGSLVEQPFDYMTRELSEKNI
jgi:phycobilisome core component